MCLRRLSEALYSHSSFQASSRVGMRISKRNRQCSAGEAEVDNRLLKLERVSARVNKARVVQHKGGKKTAKIGCATKEKPSDARPAVKVRARAHHKRCGAV